MNASMWLTTALLLPFAMLVACLSPLARMHMTRFLPMAPLPALLVALALPEGTSLVLPQVLLGLVLVLDRPGSMLLGSAALLWFIAGLYARNYLEGRADSERFTVWWLVTLIGNIGVFLAADLVSFYLFFTLVSLAAWGLIVYADTPANDRAAQIYIALAIVGEAFLLIGFVLLASATSSNSLLISDVMTALPASPWRDATLTFIILGFGVKIGLIPFHVWMPLTYSTAPIPAAAVMSGAAVKAGVIGLIRFLPLDTALSGWGEALTAVGLFSAFYGVIIGVTQSDAKAVLAYSSVSQMGFMVAIFGTGLAAGDKTVSLVAALYAVHHMLVKGGLFLAVGAAESGSRRGMLWVMLPAAVLALSLAGLPLTSGHLAKSAAKDLFDDGLISALAQLSAVASAFLMLHFLRRLHLSLTQPRMEPEQAAVLLGTWLMAALASLAVPWMLLLSIFGGTWSDALTFKELWNALWPVLGGTIFTAFAWNTRIPSLPEGDVLVLGDRVAPLTRNLGDMIERTDLALRRSSAAGLCAILLVLLAAVMVASS